MGDPHRAKRRFTGYGPIRLLCAVLGWPRTIFASFFCLLLPLMIVLFVVLLDAGFLSAGFAPIGPCVASVEGSILSDSLATPVHGGTIGGGGPEKGRGPRKV